MSTIVDFFRKVYYVKPPASPTSEGKFDEEHALQSTKIDVKSPPTSLTITDDQLQKWWTSALILQVLSGILAISNIIDLFYKCGWTVIWIFSLQLAGASQIGFVWSRTTTRVKYCILQLIFSK